MAKVDSIRLRELLSYDPDSGLFVWRKAIRGVQVGQRAGNIRANGYVRVVVDGGKYYAHRLAWLYMNGEWPADEIDHINGDRGDNRIVNLRTASHAENNQNLGMRRSNTSGHAGVCWDRRANRWRAQIMLNGRVHHLGLFVCKLDAAHAYKSGKAKLHSFHPEVRE